MSLGSITSTAVNKGLEELGISTPRNTTLKDFLAKFSDSSGKFSNQINPLNTFEVEFEFFPKPDKTKSTSWLTNLASDLAQNALDNVTGGLYSAFTQKNKASKELIYDTENNGNLMTTLFKENQLDDEHTLDVDSSINLGYYVADIIIPQIKQVDGGKSITQIGEFPLNGSYLVPDNLQFQMAIINTKLPIIDRLFYPWMREVTLPYWTYESQPYTTATITIDFNKHTDLKYVFCGCRPCQIELIHPNQENDQNLKRNVSFQFDYFFIETDRTLRESGLGKLVSTATGVGSSIGSSINF